MPAPLERPRISVITATFNRRDLLERLYDSLLKQTMFPLEWIVVDDGSDDGTGQFISSVARAAPFEIIYLAQPNSGKHVALNRAASALRGEYCIIVDSDDMLRPDAIAVLKTAISDYPGPAYIFNVSVGPSVVPDESRGFARRFRYGDVFNTNGDRTRLISGELYRAYPFPVIEGERFLTEAVVWLPMHAAVDFIELSYRPVVVEYQVDGLSAKYKRLLMNNPRGSFLAFRSACGRISWKPAYFKFLLLHLIAAVGMIRK